MNKKLLLSKYVFLDIIAAILVWGLFMVFRRVVNDSRLFSDVSIFIPNYNYYSTFLLFPLLCIIVYALSGFYVNPIKQSKIYTIFPTIISSAIISIIIFFVLLIDDIVVDYTFYYKSLLVLFALLFVITFLFRTLLIVDIRKKFKKKIWSINTIIIGTGKTAANVANEISKKSIYNQIVGFIKVDASEKEVEKEKILGNMLQIKKIIDENNVKDIIIALDQADETRLFEFINKLFEFDVEIHFVPRLYEIITGKAKIDKYGLLPFVSVSKPAMSDWQLSVKRAFDILFSLFSIVLLSPLMLYFGILIKYGSKGPVFFKQERIGRFGKPFYILKFRTMYENAENGTPRLSNPTDDRVTKVGTVLRKYRLDEIPQFFNVFKGEMSLVGPRPERKYFIDQIVKEAPFYFLIYKIRPGLTSWGPIKIGYSDTIDKMIERLNYDILYMENMSLTTDLKILVFTLEVLFRGKGM